MAEEARAPDRSSGRETLADLFVVDADVHIHEDPAELAEYAEPPWDVALREIAKVEERYLDLPEGGVAILPSADIRPAKHWTGCRRIESSAASGIPFTMNRIIGGCFALMS